VDPVRGTQSLVPGLARPLSIIGSAVAAAVVAAVVSLMVAYAVVLLVTEVFFSPPTNNDGYGALILLVVIWICSFFGCLIGSGFLFSGRTAFGDRSRWGLTAVFAGWLPAGLVAGWGIGWFGVRSGLSWLGVVVGVLFAAAVLAAGAWPARIRPIGLVAAITLGLALSAVVVTEDGYRTRLYGADQPPMGLVDEAALDEVLPGWRVDRYDDGSRLSPVGQAHLISDKGTNVVVRFSSVRLLDCVDDTSDCTSLAPLADGTPVILWEDSAVCGSFPQPASIGVRAVKPTGHWSVNARLGCRADEAPDLSELQLLLTTIRSIDFGDWIRST